MSSTIPTSGFASGIYLYENVMPAYLDTGNRAAFSNAAIVTPAPDFSVDAEAVAASGPCAEMVLGGPVLARIRATLAEVVLPAAESLRQVS